MFGNYSSVVTWLSMDTAKLLVAGRVAPVRHRSPVLRPGDPGPHRMGATYGRVAVERKRALPVTSP